jgi:hypothetical protein
MDNQARALSLPPDEVRRAVAERGVACVISDRAKELIALGYPDRMAWRLAEEDVAAALPEAPDRVLVEEALRIVLEELRGAAWQTEWEDALADAVWYPLERARPICKEIIMRADAARARAGIRVRPLRRTPPIARRRWRSRRATARAR